MPTVKDKFTGDVVSRQPYNNKGVERAAQIADTNPNWEIDASEDYAPGGSSNAMERVESYHLGGQVGQPRFGEKPIVNPLSSPGVLPKMAGNIYEKGGKANKYKKK